MVSSYDLNSFYTILKKGIPCILDDNVLSVIKSLDTRIVPIFVEPKKIEVKKKKYRPPGQEKWDEKNTYKSQQSLSPKTIEKSGVDKWLQDIRTGLNKMSAKNYESQKNEIIQCLGNCMEADDLTDVQKKDNLKTVATAIFNIASTNKFYAEMYAKLYKELMNVNIVFQEILLSHVASYSSSVKEIQYFDPESDYEKYCVNNKVNDARKATAVFLVNLMKEDVLPVMRVLNIIVVFQSLLMEYIDQEGKTNEVDEITELLFLLIKEGYDICQKEYIWKVVIKQHIDVLSKFSKKDKKSLSSRAIFKYIDMAAIIR